MTDKNHFKDKRIWITGASSGIGKAVALKLAQSGARIAISASNHLALHKLASQMGEENTMVVPLDVTNKEQNQKAVQRIAENWGGLDIAFFNAGTAEYVDIKQFDSALFERTITTNFMSMVYGIEAVLPLLRNCMPWICSHSPH